MANLGSSNHKSVQRSQLGDAGKILKRAHGPDGYTSLEAYGVSRLLVKWFIIELLLVTVPSDPWGTSRA